VSESVAITIGGWKTESVFRRYDIIDESDISDVRIGSTKKPLGSKNSLGRVWACSPKIATKTVQQPTLNSRPLSCLTS
jgi:hypothetical protein